jgi:pilus assembly protein CpaB
MLTRARLVVLLIAIAAGGGAIWFSGQMQPPPIVQAPAPAIQTSEVLVAAKDIEPGQRIQAADVKWQAWPAGAAPAGTIARAGGGNAINEIQGAFVRTSILAGDPIRMDKLIRADGSGYMAALVKPGMRAISAEISPENGVGGFVLPNDRVDVLLTRAEKLSAGREMYVSETILYDVRVLAIDQLVGEKAGQKVAIGKLATFELTPPQAERLALARRLGTISMALRGLTDQSKGRPDGRDLNESVEIVRFGVATPTLPK